MFDFIPNEVFLMAFGFILLIKGGDWFVDAAVGVAKKFGLPELLIGATVVSIGTTLPEVMTSAIAAAGGDGGIAYGNAVGSIICNTSFIAALTIAIKPGKADKKSLIFPVCMFFGVAIFYSLVAYIGGGFERWCGIVLLALFVIYMVVNVLNMKKSHGEKGEELEIPEELPDGECECGGSLLKNILFLVIGAAVIAVGADLLATNAKIVAEDYLGIPSSIVGVTIVALGTSLPELVTAITSLMKGHGALSLGNIIGANIFNLVLVSGIAITINPFELPAGTEIAGIPSSLIIDIPLMFAVMAIMTIPTVFRGKLSRVQGISLLVLYVGFIASQVVLALV